ncbi:MAG TPA: nucleotide disphospho-sugar-binding domain-containing protein [Pirellulaceae bacterium]|jgi:UDP:flavonoid glycosyltransferase YjiC (YdhE family)|nr:nucleotide disphospho-sugar-binding domain-containing protein [Pirellulaceae bacterium]
MNGLRIDLVAPPFAGHLFPLLELGRYLRDRRGDEVRIFTTRTAARAVEAAGLPLVPLLVGEESAVDSIADTTQPIGSNPFRLLAQLRRNLALMRRLKAELEQAWSAAPPDVAIVDFAVPLAGLVAQERGVRWWTSMPTPCALETRTGTPSYLGGWSPRTSRWGSLRDAAGRLAVTTFKRSVFGALRSSLCDLGFRRLYREDGTEAVYSPEKILGLGLSEFEFNDDWPACFEFVGPLTASPYRRPEAPFAQTSASERKQVLVSLGTHLSWAKRRALDVVCQAAKLTPELDYCFSYGRAFDESTQTRELEDQLPNVRCVDFVPYDQAIGRFDAAVVHGGTGVVYACLREAVPMLVWPHDYDQFDHAARIVHRGLGRRCRPAGERIAEDLRALMRDAEVRSNLQRFSRLVRAAEAKGRIVQLLDELPRRSHENSLPGASGPEKAERQ